MSPGIIKTLLVLPGVYKRHHDAPLFREREAFLEHLRVNGTGNGNLRSGASIILRVNQLLRMKTLREVSPAEIEAAARRWRKYKPECTLGRKSGPWSYYHFSRWAKKWLRFHGKLLPKPANPQPFRRKLAAFARFLHSERGFLKNTTQSYLFGTGRFLRWFSSYHRAFASVSLKDVDRYFQCKSGVWSHVTVAGEATILRAFFRFAAERGWSSSHIADGIVSPPIKWDLLPDQGPRWTDVARIIRFVGDRAAPSIRARPIILLCATYGLRALEVASLQLRNFDWQNNTFTVVRCKRRGVQQFPISAQLRAALLRYLRTVRPKCASGSLFVTLYPPFRPITRPSIYLLIRHRMDRLGIKLRHKGPHALRHACATRLLSKGTPLRDIADFLGHRGCQSVNIYAKHDLRALRTVSALDLCGRL